MARTFGGASTDVITSALTAESTQRTYFILTYRTGNGGGNLGRMWDKQTAGTATNDILYYNSANTRYEFQRGWSGGMAIWGITAPSANQWVAMGVTYDGSSASNDPIIYVNGVATALTIDTNSSGSLTSSANPYKIGNRANNDRNWAGRLCEFAVWDRILSAAEMAALGKGVSPLSFPNGLAEYVPLVNIITSRKLANPTSSGTVVVEHPRVIFPNNS